MQDFRSKFEAWIYEHAGGPDEFAKRLGVHRSTVGHWCTRRMIPGLELAMKIEKLAKGKLSLWDILEGTRPQYGKARL